MEQPDRVEAPARALRTRPHGQAPHRKETEFLTLWGTPVPDPEPNKESNARLTRAAR